MHKGVFQSEGGGIVAQPSNILIHSKEFVNPIFDGSVPVKHPEEIGVRVSRCVFIV